MVNEWGRFLWLSKNLTVEARQFWLLRRLFWDGSNFSLWSAWWFGGATVPFDVVCMSLFRSSLEGTCNSWYSFVEVSRTVIAVWFGSGESSHHSWAHLGLLLQLPLAFAADTISNDWPLFDDDSTTSPLPTRGVMRGPIDRCRRGHRRDRWRQ